MRDTIRLIEPDTDISSLKMSKMNWDVEIDNIPYYVVKIYGYNHRISSDEFSDQLWAYPRDQEPTYENLIEYPYHISVQWGIVCTPKMQQKTKYGETESRLITGTLITRNGKPFYVVHGGVGHGIDKARALISDLSDHPLDLCAIDFDKKMIGRKIWWRSEPAVITRWIDGQACIIIEPDGIEKFTTPAEFFEEDGDDYYEDNYVKTNIFDKHIWWHRD